jgi:hypothetical protein
LLTIAKLAHSLNVKPVKLVESVRQNGCPYDPPANQST